MCLGNLPLRYGGMLNRVLYPRNVTKLLAADTSQPERIPMYGKTNSIVVVPQQPVKYEFAVLLNRELCEQYGGTPGVRSPQGLAYACDIPRMTVFGQIAYPCLADSAAHMVESIVKGHVFTDGNKRTGWHIASLFCASNGYLLEPEYPEDGRDAVLALVVGQWTVDQFASWVNGNLIRR